ncbi:hypothetical protein I5770_07350 [Brucella sp. BO2]|uniref:hypothetical protein n=1 Tax=Brucella sp. BO2 TaxID=693750 RepID=UPI0002DBD494|nr:hypothetical protein [Brucella sp. BO2]QPN26981.1 hypothetical protein I5770_07350 [Brucella sp. BO2]
MNIAMTLTFESLVRALRWKALAAGEAIAIEPNRNVKDASGGKHEDWRGSTPESPV